MQIYRDFEMKIQKMLIIIFLLVITGSGYETYSQTVKTNVNELARPKNIVYKKVGLAYGTLGVSSFVFGVNNQDYCFGVSFGFLGAQVGAGISALSKKNIELNLLLNISYVGIADNKSYYHNSRNGIEYICDDCRKVDLYFCFGPVVEFNLYGFHTQFGIGFGLELIPSPPLFFQVGYTYRWGK
jgi:hypothetical protein